MYFNLLFFLIPLSLSNHLLYIDNIYTINNKNNFSLILDLKRLNISNKFIANNIFNIDIESENKNEKNKKISFICDLFYLSLNYPPKIKCLLKEKFVSNLEGTYYFRKEYFQKSFIFKFKDKVLKFTLDVLEEIFYFGMIKSFRIKKNNIDFNFKISYVIIPISMSLDNQYIYPTIVAITSILENAYSYTKYDFYILHTPNLLIENINKLKYFEKKYQKKCSINLFNMTNFKFKDARISGIGTIATYYRLVLPNLLPNINKIIFLDGDTLTFDDLKEMYDINMENYYYKGFIDINIRYKDKIDNYICAGVLLINLEKLRKDNIVNKMYIYMINNKKKLLKHDQTIINDVCHEKIGILPPKFGIFNFNSLKTLYNITKILFKNKKYRYTNKELRNAYLYPTILHCVIKPWRNKNYARKIWLYFAEKTLYYNEIKNIYNI